MLGMTAARADSDPIVRVRVTKDLYVKGKIVKAGDVALVSLADAQALRNITPPAVEFL